ncbi:hypothetical protein [Streptomyces sp. 6N106]|uniref:hypothetical protein n=1 Tax=Streptomyces sp. 6N106 TaxID=3457418 RepID=UPI003FCFC71E
MAAFDVNAARAQRLEALGLTWDFEVDGETFSLPTEIPRRSAHTLAELEDNDLDGLLALLSAFVRTREGEAAEWGLTAHLLAAVVDHLAIAKRDVRVGQPRRVRGPPEAPVPVPPGAEAADTSDGPPAAEHAPTAAELARFFG